MAIPTRRYAQEQVPRKPRSKHFPILFKENSPVNGTWTFQKFLKDNDGIAADDVRVNMLSDVLRELNEQFNTKQYVLEIAQ